MSNEPRKQWTLRIAAESAAIVASILLAFAIDALWADRQDRQEEQKSLLALRSELQSNLAAIEKQLAYRPASNCKYLARNAWNG